MYVVKLLVQIRFWTSKVTILNLKKLRIGASKVERSKKGFKILILEPVNFRTV